MAKRTLQNPWAEGLGNDYKQDLTYVQEIDENGKSTWRDGIYTKLAYDIKDPEGYNKRTVNLKQTEWGTADKIDTIKPGQGTTLSGETDGSALFTQSAYGAVQFGFPFDNTPEGYNANDPFDKKPTAIDVAEFRQLSAAPENANDPTVRE